MGKRNSKQTGEQQKATETTPNKKNEGKSELQEDTYRKIETINDLNSKINERIKHILSVFSQGQ